jgi:DNA-binding NarL/FixJ family response regulator
MLESRGDWEIIGEAGDGEQGLAQAKRHRPDIAVIDIGMLKTNGLTLTRETRRLLPAVEVLIVTDHDSRQMLQQRRKPARGGML